MKVAVNARLLTSPAIRGWNRYTLNLLAELPALGVGAAAVLWTARSTPTTSARLPPGGAALRVAPPMRFLAWQNRWLPRQCAIDGADVLHSPVQLRAALVEPLPQNPDPPRRHRPGLYGPAWDPGASVSARTSCGTGSRTGSRGPGRTGSSPSASTPGATSSATWASPPRRSVVTYESADRRFHEPIPEADRRRVRAAHGIGEPLRLLHRRMGATQEHPVPGAGLRRRGPRRRRPGPGRRAGRAARRPWRGWPRPLGVGDRLRLLGYVEDDDLPALYAEALAFAYPSEYEGFGLQLCEAMAAGCPTLAARADLPAGSPGRRRRDLQPGRPRRAFRPAPPHRLRPRLSLRAVRRARARAAAFSWRRTAEADRGRLSRGDRRGS